MVLPKQTRSLFHLVSGLLGNRYGSCMPMIRALIIFCGKPSNTGNIYLQLRRNDVSCGARLDSLLHVFRPSAQQIVLIGSSCSCLCVIIRGIFSCNLQLNAMMTKALRDKLCNACSTLQQISQSGETRNAIFAKTSRKRGVTRLISSNLSHNSDGVTYCLRR